MIFKIYDCDFGFKLNGVDYAFSHVQSLQIEDPEKNKLTRGANAGNKVGIAYKEAVKEPKIWTIPIVQMSKELKEVMDGVYDNQTRIDVYCIDRVSGSSKMAKQAILANKPQQLTIDDTPDSMNVSLTFETFDSSEVHKS